MGIGAILTGDRQDRQVSCLLRYFSQVSSYADPHVMQSLSLRDYAIAFDSSRWLSAVTHLRCLRSLSHPLVGGSMMEILARPRLPLSLTWSSLATSGEREVQENPSSSPTHDAT